MRWSSDITVLIGSQFYQPLIFSLQTSYTFFSITCLLQPRILDEKQTTVYKRAVDKNYHLKIKASRFIFSEINTKFPIMPFTAR